MSDSNSLRQQLRTSQQQQVRATVSSAGREGDGGRGPMPAVQSLAPIGDLFSSLGQTEVFYQKLSAYVRGLVGGMAVFIHRKQPELGLARMAYSIGVDINSEPSFLQGVEEQVEKTIATGVGQRSDIVFQKRQHLLLQVPFVLQGRDPLCLSAVLPPERVAFAEPCFTILHLATQFLVQRDLVNDARENAGAFHQATLLVEMFSTTAVASTFHRSLFTLANELEKFFGCDWVAIGTGNKRNCKVRAVSGIGDEESRSIGTAQLSAAMKEGLSVGKIVVWPRQAEMIGELAVSANHDDLLHSFRAGRALIVPLLEEADDEEVDGNPVGALVLLWKKEGTDLDKTLFTLVKACQPHLAALVWMLKRSKAGPVASTVGRLFRGTFAKKVATVAAALVLLGAMFFPIPYRVAADCRLQPVVRRIVAAPFENRLHRAYVKPGALVRKGDVLAELDGREIRVSLAEAVAAHSAALKKRDETMTRKNAAELQMAQLEAERLGLEVERLQFRNDNLLIRSPIDGVVLTGDLERSEGVPVSTGQKLFEIAPLDEMLIDVFIPETEVRHVDSGMDVKVRLESQSSYRYETVLEKVNPVSEVFEGDNVFVGEALLPNKEGDLRPGMKGAVRIETGPEPIGWILFHRVWEYLRLKLW